MVGKVMAWIVARDAEQLTPAEYVAGRMPLAEALRELLMDGLAQAA